MKIGFNPGSIVDLNGSPLKGRVTIYEHGTDIPKDIYTIEDDEYVQAENPQLLNVAGRLDDTIYFDASVVDVKVEKYIGDSGQMSAESPDTDFEDFDVFQAGFSLDIGQAGEIVDTIDALRNVPVSAGTVNVRGYYYAGDCSPRLYVWDASSSATEDGGYVIGSNLTASGRWILAHDGDIIPCTWYGVRPGNITNLASLLSYPDVVGTHNLRTARKIYFVAGEYASESILFSTNRVLCFASTAKFTGVTFKCPAVEVYGPVGDYIADFVFASGSYVAGRLAEAHSSWFRTKHAFWHCSASTMVYDQDNYFTDPGATDDEFNAAAAFVSDYQDKHIFTRKLRIGNASFVYDEDNDVVKVWYGQTLIATLGGADGVNSEEIHAAMLVADEIDADSVKYSAIKIETDGNDYYVEASDDVEVSSMSFGKVGERMVVRNTKDGQIRVTCKRVTEYIPEPFHVDFPMNAGNCVELLCVQGAEQPGPMYPAGQYSFWEPIAGNITLQKTIDL